MSREDSFLHSMHNFGEGPSGPSDVKSALDIAQYVYETIIVDGALSPRAQARVRLAHALNAAEKFAEDFGVPEEKSANSINFVTCECGCGNVGIALFDDKDRIFAVGKMMPDRMIVFLNNCLKETGKVMNGRRR